MKNTDIALIILIAVISVVISYFLGNWILGNPGDLTAEMTYVDSITGVVEDPEVEEFNGSMRNPTVEVYIGECEDGKVWDEDTNTCIDSEDGGDENGGGGTGGDEPTERPSGE